MSLLLLLKNAASGAVTSTVAASLASPTAALAAGEKFAGALAASLASPTVAIAAQETFGSALAGALPALVAELVQDSSAPVVSVESVFAAELAGLTAAFAQSATAPETEEPPPGAADGGGYLKPSDPRPEFSAEIVAMLPGITAAFAQQSRARSTISAGLARLSASARASVDLSNVVQLSDEEVCALLLAA